MNDEHEQPNRSATDHTGPVDHVRLAEQLLAGASDRDGNPVLDTDNNVRDYLLAAQVHATLALNDTISRLGVRQALRQAAALGAIPLDEVGLTPEEKSLLRVLFPDQAESRSDTQPTHRT